MGSYDLKVTKEAYLLPKSQQYSKSNIRRFEIINEYYVGCVSTFDNDCKLLSVMISKM